MSRWKLKLLGASLALSALASCTAVAQAAGISLNFGADINAATAVGGNSAGVAFLGNWNDVPLAQQTNLGLKNDSGVIVPGLTLSTAEAFTFPASAFDAAGSGFAQPGDTALMRGHIYHGGGTAVDLTFTGAIPFSTYDVYVYYNSGGIANTQTFSILDSSGGSLGLSQTGAEVPGGDTAFVLSDGAGNNANYVKFAGLTSSSVPTNFIIRAQGNSGGYGYFNGLQFAEAGEPPPPPPPPPAVDAFPAISINLAADVQPGADVAANPAGVVRSSNWNDIPLAQQTNVPLKDNSGAIVPGITLSTNEAFTFPASAYDSAASFTEAGDRAMMRGHIYHGGGASVEVRVDGTIPYANYDVYVYYNSGAVPNTQVLSLLASDLSDLGISATVSEVPGSDSVYVEATDATINANYVKFSGLNNLDVPSFVIRAQNALTPGSNEYAYINGIQIVNTVPEPGSVTVLACGGVVILLVARRKCQRAASRRAS